MPMMLAALLRAHLGLPDAASDANAVASGLGEVAASQEGASGQEEASGHVAASGHGAASDAHAVASGLGQAAASQEVASGQEEAPGHMAAFGQGAADQGPGAAAPGRFSGKTPLERIRMTRACIRGRIQAAALRRMEKPLPPSYPPGFLIPRDPGALAHAFVFARGRELALGTWLGASQGGRAVQRDVQIRQETCMAAVCHQDLAGSHTRARLEDSLFAGLIVNVCVDDVSMRAQEAHRGTSCHTWMSVLQDCTFLEAQGGGRFAFRLMFRACGYSAAMLLRCMLPCAGGSCGVPRALAIVCHNMLRLVICSGFRSSCWFLLQMALLPTTKCSTMSAP